MRIKSNAAHIPAKDWFEWLYTEPFEGSEDAYTDALIESVDGFVRNESDIETIHRTIKAFHERLSRSLEHGEVMSIDEFCK